MIETKVFDVISEVKLMGLINDLHNHYKVTDIQYSTYVIMVDSIIEDSKYLTVEKPEVHYTACVTYCERD